MKVDTPYTNATQTTLPIYTARWALPHRPHALTIYLRCVIPGFVRLRGALCTLAEGEIGHARVSGMCVCVRVRACVGFMCCGCDCVVAVVVEHGTDVATAAVVALVLYVVFRVFAVAGSVFILVVVVVHKSFVIRVGVVGGFAVRCVGVGNGCVGFAGVWFMCSRCSGCSVGG